MDVDLLRPGTVPISPDTLLWFEFLLDPNLLRKHLEKPTSDPSPPELIVRFLTEAATGLNGAKAAEPAQIDVETNNVNGIHPKNSKRSQALKILALKVAAYLNWDLDIFENKLPVNHQSQVLRDLLVFTSELYADPLSHDDIVFSDLPPQVTFAVSLYHRWVIRTFANNGLIGKQLRSNGLQPVPPIMEGMGIIEVSEMEAERSLKILQRIISCKVHQPLRVPSFDSLVPLTEESTDVDHRWDLCRVVSKAQFHCQVLMDISNYLINRESYPSAKESIRACLSEFHAWQKELALNPRLRDEPAYCFVNQNLVSGCCMVVGIRPANYSPSLTQQFHNSVSDQYMDITRVLERDNISKEIPMLYRDSLELDILSEAASGKLTAHRDGIQEIHATNMVRRALEGATWHTFKVTPVAVNKALAAVLPSTTDLEKDRLRYFLLELLALCDVPFVRELSEQPSVKQLLTESEMQEVQENDYTDPIPHVLISNEVETLSVKNSTTEISTIERQVISSYDPHEIKTAILKLVKTCPVLDMGKLNRSWEMPMPVYNSILNLLRGTLQHYVYALVAKAYELDHMKNYSLARTMLRISCDEVNRETGTSVNMQLVQILSWEILLVDIHQFHAEWPAKHIDWSGLSRECIGVLHSTDVCRPRFIVYEQSALALLNMGQWQALINSPPPNSRHSVAIAEFYISIATACLDINKYNKKISTDAWDKLLPIFLNANGQKRRDSLTTATNSVCSVVEMNALAVVVSLLAKLHNILTNQQAIELFIHFTALWPTTLKNSNQYNIKFVSEMLYEVLNHALKLYPQNVAWLKLYGDLNFANSHYSTALKYYLEAAIAGTDYFARPISRNIIEDHIYKRMIKCCTQLQCHTQAAVLCQFLEEVDYTVAYKSFAEASCSDSMDSYYDCIWDITLLEYLINLHNKRGEHYRKQKVVRMIGLLELNSNNNEEIRREAENIRKAKFLRAMAKQYIC